MSRNSYRSGLDRFLMPGEEISIPYDNPGRTGIITNHTGLTCDLKQNVDLLQQEQGLELVKIFSPEHGFRGTAAAGEEIADTSDEKTGLPVISLYGDNKKPTEEQLQDLDTLIYDIQDVGVRYYTYISTLLKSLAAACEQGINFIVFDRYNPLGRELAGNMLEEAFKSFVGPEKLPLCYGLTPGELARLFMRNRMAERAGVSEEILSIVKLSGWSGESVDEMDVDWVPPSPNLPAVESLFLYPVLTVLEGTNLSEGRGTTLPFRVAGAPWLPADEIAEYLDGLQEAGLSGFKYRRVSFQPHSSKHSSRECQGLQFFYHLRQPENRLDPLAVGLIFLGAVMAAAPEKFEFRSLEEGEYFFDKLIGSDRPRREFLPALKDDLKDMNFSQAAKRTLRLCDKWAEEREEFREEIENILIY